MDYSEPIKGRGAHTRPQNRFEKLALERDLDSASEDDPGPQTEFFIDQSRSLITYNDSPDIGFSAGINVYRGCEHGCIYCYARPSHEYLGFSAGLDFETRIMVKRNAPQKLREELMSPRWKPQVLAMSGNTDCYQPAERRLKLTRGCLEVLAEFRNPVAVITKNFLITRDIDLLQELARYQAVVATVSVTSLDHDISRKMEPRASHPNARLQAIEKLAQAGIPVGVNVAPVVPGLTDHEMPAILKAAAERGARFAHYVMIRLPFGVKQLFEQWVFEHFPDRAKKILHKIQELRGGRLNDPRFTSRMTGEGLWAKEIGDLFEMARRKANIPNEHVDLSTAHFRRPGIGRQLDFQSL